MPYSGVFTSTSPSKLKMDTGIDVINRATDAFVVFTLIAVVRLIALEVYRSKGSFSKNKIKPLLEKVCKEGAYWGGIVALYAVLMYALTITHFVGDWKVKLLAGVLTGAIVSGVCDNGKDKVVEDAVTGGAIATAAAFLGYLA